jgi:FtsZ-binding cell division protein ZapB
MARGNESSSSSESDSDDDLPSYNTIVQQNLKYAKICTSQQKKLKTLKEELGSSQEAYKNFLEQYKNFANLNVELSTKIEQLEASATTSACTIDDKQLEKKNEKLKEKLASPQNDYQSLLAKMEIMCKHCDELTNKVANLEAVKNTPTKASKKKSSIIKKDASTSCNDLCLDSPLCNQVCVEKVIVDTCTQVVAKENEQLKQEVARLTKDLTQVKGKAKQTQLHQDNTIKGVKKLDEGQTVVCYVCHKEGHKSYECKVKNGGGAKKKEKKQTSKLSNTYTNKVDKKASTPYLLKKKKNDKVVAIKVNKQTNNGVKRFWEPKEIISNMKSTKKVWIPKVK